MITNCTVYKVIGQILLRRVTAAHITECDGSQSNPNVIQMEVFSTILVQ